MSIKIRNYKLRHPQNICPGLLVCSSISALSVGVIVDINKGDISWYSKDIEVLWITGSKKGKKDWNSYNNLSDFDAYISAIRTHLVKLDSTRSKVVAKLAS
jgi:hypothetical protein